MVALIDDVKSRGVYLRKQDRLPPPTGPKIPVGCFAPPLTDELLASYVKLIKGCQDDEIKEALMDCLACVEAWWELPVSTHEPGQPITVLHRGKESSFREVPLQDDHVEQLWDVTPWLREVDAMKVLFGRLPTGEGYSYFLPKETLPDGRTVVRERRAISDPIAKELRDAAHHLLWYVQELALYREPLTSDVLKG